MITNRDKEVLEHFGTLVVSFSAGKDSLSCLLWALETDKPLRVIMTDTGNEPPDGWDYIRYVERALGVKVEIYQRQLNGHTRNFEYFVRHRKMWPLRGRCLVSSSTKRDDFKWYLKETNTPLDALIILGQRRSESKRRRQLPDFSTVIRSGRACYRPILDWSIDDVMNYAASKNIQVHPAYAKGRKRVGCIWCVNSSHDDLARDEELYPGRCAELRALRASIGLQSIPEGARQLTMFDQVPMCKYEAVHCE